MDVAARAETWLRVCTGRLLGPPAPIGDDLDLDDLLVLSSVAHALSVLEVLPDDVITTVLADLDVTAALRGIAVSSIPFNPVQAGYRKGSELRRPVTEAGGACLEVGETLVQLLWVTRTAEGCFAPARVRLPAVAAGGARPVEAPRPPRAAAGVPPAAAAAHGLATGRLATGLPPLAVVDDAGGRHVLHWSQARGDGRTLVGMVVLLPDLPAGVRPVALGIAKGAAGGAREAALARVVPVETGRLGGDGRPPAARYLELVGSGRWSAETATVVPISAARDGTRASLAARVCGALAEIGLLTTGSGGDAGVDDGGEAGAAGEDGTVGGRGAPAWRHRGAPVEVPVGARPLGVDLPLERIAVHVEGYTLDDVDRLILHARLGHEPVAEGPPWWSAVDAEGRRHAGHCHPQWHGGDGRCLGIEFDLPPRGGPLALRVTAATPFESAHLDIEVPRR